MAEITLRAYMRETDDLIEHEQLDEAIAHCRHILQTFPKHLQTYRLLGKAYVEAKRYGDAADLFQRVLSSVPDDFVAHVGMSIVREDEGNLDAAIWHMERAYETNPAHPAIQQELRKLIGRRDGLEPHKARLTRGALARMYAQGELFAQGVAELRAALKEDPDRPDLQVLLAEMYWRLDQRVEAVDVCNRILEKLPYCRDANRIMASILHAQGRTEEAATYVRRLAALDPYVAFAESPSASPESVDAGLVRLEKFTWQRGQAAPSGAQPRPDWVAPMGMDLREKQGAPAEAGLPAWLQAEETTEIPAPKAPPAETPPAPPIPAREPAQPAAELPDWMRDAGWAEATGQAAEAPVSFSDAELEGLESGAPPSADTPLAPAEIPGWLKDIAPASIAAAPSAPAFARGGNGGEEELPPWLGEIAGETGKPTVEAAKTPLPSARAPAEPRMTGADRAGIPGSQEPPEAAEPIEERILPPWLEQETPGATSTIVTWLGDRSSKEQKLRKAGEAGAAAVPPETPSAPASPGQAAPPDWLSGLRGLGESDVPVEPAEEPAPVEAGPPAGVAPPSAAGPGTELDWLRNLTSAGKEAPGEGAEGAGGAVPDWLTVPYEEIPEQYQKAGREGGVPLAEEEALPAEQPETAGTYDWLRGFEAGEPEPLPESVKPPSWIPEEESPAEAEGEPEIARAPAPDWLRELASSVEGAPAVPEAVRETPDWLKGILDEAPSEAQALPTEGAAAEVVAGPGEPVAAEPPPAEAIPDWLKGLDATAVGEPASAEAAASSVEWLPETPEPAPELAAGPGEAGIQPPSWERIAEETTSEAEMGGPLAMAEAPDWLKELSRPEGLQLGESGLPTEIPSWADQVEAEAAAMEEPLAMGETPDWLRELVETEGKPAEAGAPSTPIEQPLEAPIEEAAPTAEGVDWLETFAEPATTPSAATAEAAPDWLAEFADREVGSGETPSWLTEATPWPIEVPGEAPSPRAEAEVQPSGPEAEEGVPDWLLSAAEQPTQFPATAFEPAAPEMAGAQEEAVPVGAEGEGLEDTEIFQWLEDIAGIPEGSEAGVELEPAEPVSDQELAAPEFMTWTGLEAAEVPPAEGKEESLDWLQQLAEEGGVEVPEQAAQPEGVPTTEEVSEVPEWLLSMEAELAKPPAAAQAEPVEEPVWLEMAPEEAGVAPEETVAGLELPEAVELEMGPEAALSEELRAEAESVLMELPEVMSLEIEEPVVETPPVVEATPVLLAPQAPPAELEAPVEAPQPAEAVLLPVSPVAEPKEEVSPVKPPIPIEEAPIPSPVIPPPAVPQPEPRRPVRLEEMLASEPAWLKPVSVPPPARPSKAELGVADWLLLATRKPRPEQVVAPAVPQERAAAPIKAEKLPRRAEIEEERKPAPRRKATQAGASDLLDSARKALDAGDVSLAVEKYGVLIRRKMEVHAVIQDLKTALGRSPRAAPLWQALGDAYMRGNQVAEAAEAYRHGMEAA